MDGSFLLVGLIPPGGPVRNKRAGSRKDAPHTHTWPDIWATPDNSHMALNTHPQHMLHTHTHTHTPTHTHTHTHTSSSFHTQCLSGLATLNTYLFLNFDTAMDMYYKIRSTELLILQKDLSKKATIYKTRLAS